jgi:hypothetical protein
VPHKPDHLSWHAQADQEWAAKVALLPQTRDGGDVVLSGPCPRCGHLMSAAIEVEASTRLYRVTAASGSGTNVVYCNCTSDHHGRPDGDSGCGAYGALVQSR